MKLATPLLLVVLLTGCGASAPTAPAPSATLPGNPAVYERITALTDCADLQAEFDTASANHDRAEPGSDDATWTTAYMKAADERLRALDCY